MENQTAKIDFAEIILIRDIPDYVFKHCGERFAKFTIYNWITAGRQHKYGHKIYLPAKKLIGEEAERFNKATGSFAGKPKFGTLYCVRADLNKFLIDVGFTEKVSFYDAS